MEIRIRWIREPDLSYEKLPSVWGIALVKPFVGGVEREFFWYPKDQNAPEDTWTLARKLRGLETTPMRWVGLHDPIEVKVNIIREAYGIDARHRIPSEFLWQANLWYSQPSPRGTWVDEWCSPDLGGAKIETFGAGFPGNVPLNRKIRLNYGVQTSVPASRILPSDRISIPKIRKPEEPPWGLVPCARDWEDSSIWAHEHDQTGRALKKTRVFIKARKRHKKLLLGI